LLLKQGYRIEYAAVADAETYAPEGFHEFFNQRRRWTPSSIANTVDLLADYKVSTFEAESDKMLLYNSLPVLTFIGLCFIADSNSQIIFAKLISVIYGFVMLAVAIATTNQIILETALSPTPIFVLCMIGIFVLAAILHPQEFHNIFYGLIFFLMIPCTYIFMSLYALINLNIINWGTREAASVAIGNNASHTEFRRLLQRFGLHKVIDFVRSTSSWRSAITTTTATTTATTAATDVQEIQKKIDNMKTELQELKDVVLSSSPSTPFKRLVLRENMNRFLWMDTEYLQVCSRGRLNAAEDEFWNGMIEQYLKPLEFTEEEMRRDVASLVSLRNRIASSVLIVNGLLVLAVFLIQKHKEILSFQYKPYEGFEWSKLSKKTGKFELTDEPLKVEPIGLFIIAFLLIILVVQTCGMFAHRITTLVGAFHEVSSMEDFDFSNKNFENENRIKENGKFIDVAFNSNQKSDTLISNEF
uniref:Chitin synthase n=1 Tax=Brugia timori TaxID=42155 RepID=A0A0R3R572_9BILA